MAKNERKLAIVLLVLFISVGFATLHEGWLIFQNHFGWAQASNLDLQKVENEGSFPGNGSVSKVSDLTITPLSPVAEYPVSNTENRQSPPDATPELNGIAEAFSLDQGQQVGRTTITVFAPWGESLVFSFQSVVVDFQAPEIDRFCPFDQQNACINIENNGVYVLAHSEYPGAVAEQARSMVEGTLYPLKTIQRNVAMLTGAEAEILFADGRSLRAEVAQFARITGSHNIFNTANHRQAQPESLIIEFCGLPHLEDQSDAAGTTGSIYLLTLTIRE